MCYNEFIMIEYELLSKLELIDKCKKQRFVLIKLNKEIETLEKEVLYLKQELLKLKKESNKM